MKSITLCLLAFSILSAPTLAEEKISNTQAQATAYIQALFTGDVEKANALIAVPYSMDRKSVLKTHDEVAAIHKKIAESKGQRPLPKFKIAKTDKAPELDAAVFPKYEAFRVVIEDSGKTENIDIYVTTGDSPAVIGFSD